MSAIPIVSCIVVSYRSLPFLIVTLNQLVKISKDIPIEIIVVDNASGFDHSRLLNLFPSIKFIFLEHNIGFGAANNLGSNYATSDCLLILNPDTIIDRMTIESVVTFINSNTDHTIGGVGVRMLDGYGKFLPESKRSFPNFKKSIYRLTRLDRIFSGASSSYYDHTCAPSDNSKVEVLAGACIFIRKSVFQSIGGFDKRYFMYGEDIDLSYRLVKAGYTNYYLGSLPMIHFKGESSKRESWKYFQQFYDALYTFWYLNMQKSNCFFKITGMRLLVSIVQMFAYTFFIIRSALLPTVDYVLIYFGLVMFTFFWSENLKGDPAYYPNIFYIAILPIYVFLIVFYHFISRVYESNVTFNRLFSSVVFCSISIIVFYSFLPENYRYSRAILLVGSTLSAIVPLFSRFLFFKLKLSNFFIWQDEIVKFHLLPHHTDSLTSVLNLFHYYTSSHYVNVDLNQPSQLRVLDIERSTPEDLIRQLSDSRPTALYISSIRSIIFVNSSNETSDFIGPGCYYRYFQGFQPLLQSVFHSVLAMILMILYPMLFWALSSSFTDLIKVASFKYRFYFSTSITLDPHNIIGLYDLDKISSRIYSIDSEYFYTHYTLINDLRMVFFLLTKADSIS